MLTKTTISAIRALVHLGLHGGGSPISPRRMAEQLGESPTYLAKVMRLLVRTGILRAHYGATGGVVLNHDPQSITLLAITEACQGTLLANLCLETDDLASTCAFHQAGAELHQAILGVMSHWTLADFLRNPSPAPMCEGRIRCWLQSGDKLASTVAERSRPREPSVNSRTLNRGKKSTKKSGKTP